MPSTIHEKLTGKFKLFCSSRKVNLQECIEMKIISYLIIVFKQNAPWLPLALLSVRGSYEWSKLSLYNMIYYFLLSLSTFACSCFWMVLRKTSSLAWTRIVSRSVPKDSKDLQQGERVKI